jgi:hypothetical protein
MISRAVGLSLTLSISSLTPFSLQFSPILPLTPFLSLPFFLSLFLFYLLARHHSDLLGKISEAALSFRMRYLRTDTHYSGLYNLWHSSHNRLYYATDHLHFQLPLSLSISLCRNLRDDSLLALRIVLLVRV